MDIAGAAKGRSRRQIAPRLIGAARVVFFKFGNPVWFDPAPKAADPLAGVRTVTDPAGVALVPSFTND